MFAGPFASGGKRKPGLGGVSITSLNVNLLTRARKAVSGLRRRGFRDYYALKGASLRLNVECLAPNRHSSAFKTFKVAAYFLGGLRKMTDEIPPAPIKTNAKGNNPHHISRVKPRSSTA